jgi:uncharacterized protein (TIGR02466 family)
MIEMWFPTLIDISHLDQFKPNNDSYAQCVYNVRDNSPKRNVQWKCDTFSTLNLYDMKSDPLFADLISACASQVKIFAREYGVDSDPVCIDSWLNLAPPKEYQEYHMHAKSHFSVVYYVKTPKDCGNLSFRSSEANTDMFPLPASVSVPANYKTCTYTPQESMLVIFRSNLLHMVEKNKSDEDRISISINFNV